MLFLTLATVAIEWNLNLGVSSLSVTTEDTVTLQWTGGHNIYRAEGSCSEYSDLASFQSASSYTVVESGHPGGSTYNLPIPSVTTQTAYCFACITHWTSMRLTLDVSPATTPDCSCKPTWTCDANQTINGCPSQPCDGDELGSWCEAEVLPCKRSIPSSLEDSISNAWPLLVSSVDPVYYGQWEPASLVEHILNETSDFFYCDPNHNITLTADCTAVRSYYEQSDCCGNESALLLGKTCSSWKTRYGEEGCCTGTNSFFPIVL